jgi:hypothetical protein
MTRKVVCQKSFNPAVFMGESWSAAEQDERAERLPEIDVSAITLVNCLRKDEELPTGERCVKLLKETAYLRLGGRAFLALWEDQSAIVLRNHEVGNCWTVTLDRLDGQYTSTFEQKAGGPFDTEAQAAERQRTLENAGTCNRD